MGFIQTLCTIGTATVPTEITGLIRNIITAIQIGVPVLLVIWGMLDLGKAVIAQKEDEIKKGQQVFMKRLLAAAIVFFVIVIVKFIVQLVGGDTGCLEAIF
ncbi:MAG: hypothetical protein ACM3O4_01820 [Ignavibacteriales bacterium]